MRAMSLLVQTEYDVLPLFDNQKRESKQNSLTNFFERNGNFPRTFQLSSQEKHQLPRILQRLATESARGGPSLQVF